MGNPRMRAARPATRFMLLSVSMFTAVIVTANAVGTGGDESVEASAFTRTVPRNTADLRAIQDAAARVADHLTRCTVGIQLGPAHASGVIVSKDGYVLTAAHVVARPGLAVQIRLWNGRQVAGRTLGMNPDVDGGLIRITSRRTWSHVPLVPRSEAPKPGDWCLALGHPGGYHPDRSAPVRLGRVISADDYVIRSDCPIQGGDSGGALFDLEGRVTGIHSRISEDLTVNLHVPSATFQDTWDQLKAARVTRHAAPSRFLALFDTNHDGTIERSEIPVGPFRKAFDRIAADFNLDPNESFAIEELRGRIGLAVDLPDRLDLRNPFPLPDRFLGDIMPRDNILSPNRFVRGADVRSVFGDAVKRANPSVVRIELDEDPVVLGTIISSDGWVVTKASALANALVDADSGSDDRFVCRLTDGRRLAAEQAGSDTKHDLALLHVDARNLPAVEWIRNANPKIGTWLISSSGTPRPASVGVVSVLPRAISRSRGVLGIHIGEHSQGVLVTGIADDSGAERAGLTRGDVVTHVKERAVHSIQQLQAAIRRFRVGDAVELTVLRDAKPQERTVVLGMYRDAFFRDDEQLAGPLSRRRDDFPDVIQHDSVLRPEQCGGPVVDLDGRVLGINIARADRTASYAVPTRTVEKVVATLRAASKRDVTETDAAPK